MITDTALIFEGGGMRASYTAGALVTLMEQGFRFSDVYGISAGSSHTVNYVSGDVHRAKISFVDFMAMGEASGWGYWLRGKGYFYAEYIYQLSCLPGQKLVYDFDAFRKSPTRPHIEAFERDTGRTVYWGKEDMPTLNDLMIRVRASSTMPIFMPPVTIGGQVYYDGGIGDSWGIPLAQARRDGYKKFFLVCTQKRGYRKEKEAHPAMLKCLFAAHPIIARRMLDRPEGYNAVLEEIADLERQGDAYVFYPETMPVKNTTVEPALLHASYAEGYAQAQRELPAWCEFLSQ
ncbi:alpha-beta hydrolase esterase [Clostridia bacterium]|nr:alpha-beta hydrolase esterase [Clostridia bacterium]